MNEIPRQAVDHALAATASKATYTGSATTMAGWALSNEFIALGGFALAVLGFVINLYFKVKEDRRQQAAHDAHMLEIANRHTVVKDAVSTALSRNDLVEHYSGMPKPPSKPDPKPVDDEGSK